MGLGIDIGLLLTQVINFLIILFVLKRFLYQPVLRVLDKRRKDAEEIIKHKGLAEEETAKQAEKRKKVLREAQEEGSRIIARAIADAKREEERILADARREASEEYDKRMAEVDRERRKTIDEARKQALDYAVVISEKILKATLTKEEQERLLKEAVGTVAHL